MVKIIPAIFSTNLEDYARLARQFSTFCDTLHIDVSDGIYATTKTPPLKQVIYETGSSIMKNIHLMCENPLLEVQKLVELSNINWIYVHVEFISLLGQYSPKIVPVIQIHQNPLDYIEILRMYSHLQIMTVKIGKQGNKFDDTNLKYIPEIKKLLGNVAIHIDGHVGTDTIHHIMEYKPKVLNVGSYLSNTKNPQKKYDMLTNLAKQYSV
jgi:pentose-5-phosphate-3-epimerase